MWYTKSRYYKLLNLSNHACKRFWAYTEDMKGVGNKDWSVKKIKSLVARKLAKEIRRGLFVDKTGAIHIPIDYGLYAAIIMVNGGYLVVTFHKNLKNIDIEDLRKEYKKSLNN